jgi:hypothetical protein
LPYAGAQLLITMNPEISGQGEKTVARKRQPQERKLRTREHVLADLGVNYVERQILRRGFAGNRLDTDYGIDLLMLTYSDAGEVESGHVLFQVKATDSLQILKDGRTIVCRVEVADLKAWQEEWLPVILVVYDGRGDKAYWLYVQQYLEGKNVSGEDLLAEQDRVTIRIPRNQRLNRKAIEKFRQWRNQNVDLMKGGLRHGHGPD